MMNNYPDIMEAFFLEQIGGKEREIKWETLEHNGVMFPKEYEKHNIPVLYDGKPVKLNKEAEEIATMYASYIGKEYVNNKVFNKNFWEAWKKTLGPDTPIKNLNDVDFTPITDYIIEKKVEKAAKPKQSDTEAEKYKYAIVDGKQETIGNYKVEPPGIFIGRGCNPNLGKLKKRVRPEDITINVGKDAKVPKPPAGHKWHDVVHDQTGVWLASWKDDITGKTKYVRLANDSTFKSDSDINKFDLARKLKKKVKSIRAKNDELMKSANPVDRQLATALYFIDNFALRVGNKKGDNSADTVGVLTLRSEHVTPIDGKIKLDFLGKDSVRYNRTLDVSTQVYKNVVEMLQGKGKKDKLFDLINAQALNKYLESYMKGLTSKVFRTYNASHVYQKELKKIDAKMKDYTASDKLNVLLDMMNKANAKVAMLCNHQKNVNASLKDQLTKLDEQIKKAKKKIKDLQSKNKPNKERIEKAKIALKKLRAKKDMKIQLKNISLGTSKINYIDPRITIAFIKRNNIPIEKVFTKTLQDKFKWAYESAGPDFVF